MSNDPNALNWEQFAQHIQTSLNALYDYAALHANPAVHLLTAANPADQDEVEHFRDLISEAVEKLRPDASLPLTARSARPYHILRMRYIEQHDIPRILYQLALSKRQFYRENAKAIEAITLILWERVAPPDAPPIAAQSAPQATLHSEIHRVSGSSGQVDLSQLVAGVLESVAALASRRGIALSVAAGQDQAVLIYTDRVLLRQTLLVLLSHLLTHAAGTIELAWSGDGIAVTIQPPLEDTALPAELDALIASLDAELSDTPDLITLRFGTEQHSILIIDDNPDVLELFRQYLAEQPYQVVTLANGAQALQTARDLLPDSIILDLMLPGQDGLEILQALKSHPATAAIPVLVCSVLNMAELALSLGAEAYLPKPPARAELIELLAKWQG